MSTPVIESMTNKPMQATPLANADNFLLSVGDQQTQEPTAFMTRSEVERNSEARDEESFYIFSTPRLEATISCRGGCETLSCRYVVPHLHKFDGRKGNTNEHFVHFLNSIGAFTLMSTYP